MRFGCVTAQTINEIEISEVGAIKSYVKYGKRYYTEICNFIIELSEPCRVQKPDRMVVRRIIHLRKRATLGNNNAKLKPDSTKIPGRQHKKV